MKRISIEVKLEELELCYRLLDYMEYDWNDYKELVFGYNSGKLLRKIIKKIDKTINNEKSSN